MITMRGFVSVIHTVAVALLTLSALDQGYSQYIPWDERGDPVYRRRAEMEANKLSTSLFNFGFTGRTGIGQGTPYEWPTGTDRHYIALSTMFVGGEVVDINGDTISIVSVPAYRQNPANGATWNFEPVPEYLGADQIARNDDPSTWPAVWIDKMSDSTDPGWPGSWNGLLGKNALIDGTEYYYHFSDDLYDRYQFYPDSADATRRGLGIVVSERVLEWREFLLEDALITVSEIFNVGALDIERAAATFWIADFVGGDGDSQDDKPTYDLVRELVHLNDYDGVSSNPAFLNARVGTPTMAFIETPGNLGMTNVQYLPAGSINFSTTPDSFFWQTFMEPGIFFDPDNVEFGENDLFASCGFFPLPAGSSQRFITGWVFAEDSLNGKRKASYLKSFVAGGFSTGAVDVSILAPLPGQVVSGTTELQWNANDNAPELLTDILFSSDFGESWILLAADEANDGSFFWYTDTVNDGVLYKLHVIAYDSGGIGYSAMDSSFTINNGGPAVPEIRFISPQGGEVFQDEIVITWFGGDADGDPVEVSLSYRIDDEVAWTQFADGIGNSGMYVWNSAQLPNAASYWLRAEIRDGVQVGVDSVGLFQVQNPRYGIDDSAFTLRTTLGTGFIQPRIADTTQVTGHRYRVEFSVSPDSTTTYDVFDETASLTVVDDATEVYGNVEGPLFDGIRLLIRNDSLAVSPSSPGWNRAGIYEYQFQLFTFGFQTGLPEYGDYLLQVGSVGLDTSLAITLGSTTYPSRPVNFMITNTVTGQRVPFGFVELDGTDGRFTARVDGFINRTDLIVMLTMDTQDSLVFSWRFSMNALNGGSNPETGDLLQVYLLKPFRTGDSYTFDAIVGPLLGVKEESAEGYVLFQNFPNPFNPITEIRFSLGARRETVLEVYDILGQRVRTLVNDQLVAGNHSVQWDGRNDHGRQVASGMYLYRLRTGAYVKTYKMLLLR